MGAEDLLTLISSCGESVLVDRSLFLQKSEYYKALVTSGMRDSESKSLKLDILSWASLKEVHDFFVRISNDKGINYLEEEELNVEAGLEASSYLQIDEMVDRYCKFLLNNLNNDTWFYILDLCQKYGSLRHRDVALEFVCTNFLHCSAEEDFLHLTRDQIEFIMQSDKTFATNEVSIFASALKWLMHEPSRSDLILKLLKNVRFELMNDCELQESRALLDSMGLQLADINSIFDNKNNPNTRMRCPVKTIVALGGFTKKEFSTNRFQIFPTSELQQILQERKEESPAKPSPPAAATIGFKIAKSHRLPKTLCEHGACVLNGNLYIAGGQVQYHDSGRMTTNEVFVFNPIRQQWSSCTSMNYPRSLFYFGRAGDFLYAVSGCTACNTDTESVEKYHPNEDRWEMVSPLDVRVHELAGCDHGESIYVSGGFRGPARGHVDLVWRYDPGADRWTRRARMLTPRSYHIMVVIKGRLLAIGGVRYLGLEKFQDVMDGEMYDPAANQWSRVLKLQHPASCMASVVVSDHVLLFGGHSFVHNREHKFVQAVGMIETGSTSATSRYSEASGSKRVKKAVEKGAAAFDCRVFDFEAHGIFGFGLCEIDLAHQFVGQFR